MGAPRTATRRRRRGTSAGRARRAVPTVHRGGSEHSRLAGSTSTYLRQHADNRWTGGPGRDEAFAEARRRDVPVLLSIGYASCHWCHVMARESFSDAGHRRASSTRTSSRSRSTARSGRTSTPST